MLRRTIYFLLVLILLGGLGGAIAWYAFDFKPKMIATIIAASPPPVETVSAEEAAQAQWEPRIEAIGTLTAVNGIEIAPQVGGVVKELFFDSGATVKQGDRLVQLDTDTEEADLKNFRAQLANAEAELGRKQTVVKKGFAPKADLDNARSSRDQLLASIERTEALIAQKAVYAPWDGKLGLRDIAPGKYIAPGQAIVWLQTVDPIFADFTVPAADVGRLAIGQTVTARFDAYPDQAFEGEIVTPNVRVSADSRMLTVRARLPNAEGKLLPGMYANVLVTAGETQPVVTVPQTAITYSLYGDSVFVVAPGKEADPATKEPSLVVERRIIKTGGVRQGKVEVLSGVKPGEQIVTAGQNKIGPGSNVKIDNSIALNLDVDRMSQ